MRFCPQILHMPTFNSPYFFLLKYTLMKNMSREERRNREGSCFWSFIYLCMAGAECVSDESRTLPLYSSNGLTGHCRPPLLNLGHSLQQGITSLTVLDTHSARTAGHGQYVQYASKTKNVKKQSSVVIRGSNKNMA